MISYEITKIAPKQLKVQIKYSLEGFPDFWRNLTVEDFSAENIHALAESHAQAARQFYDTIGSLPDEITLEQTTGSVKNIVHAEPPEFDPETQNLQYSWEETDTQKIQVITVVDKTALELEQALNTKRNGVEITMRQARLYLKGANLLDSVEQVIASLPLEQKEVVEIEWNFGSTIQRMSSTVELIQGSLVWTDDQVDQMFSEASLL